MSPGLIDEVPAGVVTVTCTNPAAPAGDVTATRLDDTLVMAVPRLAPKCTAVVPDRLMPLMNTLVPPAVGPEAVGPTFVLMKVTAGWFVYVNRSPESMVEVPAGVVTVTWTVPVAPAGAMTDS